MHTHGELESQLDDSKIESEAQSRAGCYSISVVRGEEFEEVKQDLEGVEDIKSSRRGSVRREEVKVVETDYRRRICKICSKNTCGVF